MTHRLPSRRHARATALSVVAVVLVCLVLALGLLATGCGGNSSGTDTSVTSAASQTTATAAAAKAMSGSELGQAIGAAWAEAMQKLNGMLASQPEASTVQSQVAGLKEEYVQKFVAYGEQKQALDSAGKAQVDTAVVSALNDAANTDWYKNYMSNFEAYSYASGDVEFTNLLASFNILSQYADFELLKKQAPEEAARLGIK